eukprot:1145913-Pelagomonas_calceolata.AAC.6
MLMFQSEREGGKGYTAVPAYEGSSAQAKRFLESNHHRLKERKKQKLVWQGINWHVKNKKGSSVPESAQCFCLVVEPAQYSENSKSRFSRQVHDRLPAASILSALGREGKGLHFCFGLAASSIRYALSSP